MRRTRRILPTIYALRALALIVALSATTAWVAGCIGGKVTPEAVAQIQAQQAAVAAALEKQAAAAQAQLEAARVSGDLTKIDTATKNVALVAKARDFLSKGTTTVNLILQPDGSIDLTPIAGMLATVPGGAWAGLGVAVGVAVLREWQTRNRLQNAKANTAEAEKALSALWNATPDGPGPSDNLSPAVLSKIHSVDSKVTTKEVL